MGLSQKQLFAIIMSLIAAGVGVSLAAFFGSRQDANVRLATTTGVLTLGGTLIGIVATLLNTNKPHPPDPTNLPPGSTLQSTQQETVQTPSKQ